jgi:VWFA-related protein
MKGAILLMIAAAMVGSTSAQEQEPQRPRPTFRSSVARVAVTAIVRDQNGRPVTNLRPEEFQLTVNGKPRAIQEVRRDATPVRLALLVDFSGSMNIAAKRDAAAGIARHVVSWLEPGVDEAGLFAFDSQLHELQPLTPETAGLLGRLGALEPYGTTSLFDAIASTGERVAAEGGSRRAVVALTDGADNTSRLTAAQVSGIASAIDVPVYVVLVISPLDRAGSTVLVEDQLDAIIAGRLGDLARWTGGAIFAATGPARTSSAARTIVDELRHQYLIAFEPGDRPGWHPIELRTTRKNLIVRTRSGYVVEAGATVQ